MTAEEIRANDWLNGDHVDNSYGRITIDLLIEIAAQLAEANEMHRRIGYVHRMSTNVGPSLTDSEIRQRREHHEPSVSTSATISGDTNTGSAVPILTRNEQGKLEVTGVTVNPPKHLNSVYLEWLEEDNSRVLDVYHRVEYEGCTIKEAMDWFIDQQYKPTPPSTDNNPA